ncbi:MAG: hypothetical protein AAF349_13205 [Cyanobacteria bacterium P01_A01_bin.68]
MINNCISLLQQVKDEEEENLRYSNRISFLGWRELDGEIVDGEKLGGRYSSPKLRRSVSVPSNY